MLKNARVRQVQLNTDNGICQIHMDNREEFKQEDCYTPGSFRDYIEMLRDFDNMVFDQNTEWVLQGSAADKSWKECFAALGAKMVVQPTVEEVRTEITETPNASEAKAVTKPKKKARKEAKKDAKKEEKQIDIPSVEALEREYERLKYMQAFRSKLRSTIFSLITVSALAILVASLLLPVLKIYGTSMTPTLSEGSIVVSVKKSNFETGDVIAFYFNNRILVKRVIAFPGDWVDFDEDGHVFVNGEIRNEPYVDQPAMGDCDIDLPYQVPDGKLFVMGDHRSTSQDSRLQMIGCVAEEQIVGQIVYKLWPFEELGGVN